MTQDAFDGHAAARDAILALGRIPGFADGRPQFVAGREDAADAVVFDVADGRRAYVSAIDALAAAGTLSLVSTGGVRGMRRITVRDRRTGDVASVVLVSDDG